MVREAGEPWVDERRTDSKAKKQPATAALNPVGHQAERGKGIVVMKFNLLCVDCTLHRPSISGHCCLPTTIPLSLATRKCSLLRIMLICKPIIPELF